MAQDGIKYIKQEFEAFDMIDKGTAEASFIMAYPKMKILKIFQLQDTECRKNQPIFIQNY